MSFLKDSELDLQKAKEESRTAWLRFINGLKMDGRQRADVCRLLYAYQERTQRLEQEVWDVRRTLDRTLDERDRFWIKLEDV